jgi:hypothetical protein
VTVCCIHLQQCDYQEVIGQMKGEVAPLKDRFVRSYFEKSKLFVHARVASSTITICIFVNV